MTTELLISINIIHINNNGVSNLPCKFYLFRDFDHIWGPVHFLGTIWLVGHFVATLIQQVIGVTASLPNMSPILATAI